MALDKRLHGAFEIIQSDLEAAEALARIQNRNAAYQVQQAAEKLLKAALWSLNLEGGREHRLDTLLDLLPAESPWIERIRPLVKYTAYATTYRYPTPSGRVPGSPPEEELLADIALLRTLLSAARQELLP